MGQAFYRKYRSKSFDEVIGQEHVTRTLKNALESGRISHAYLFTGPKGVGKTSVARISAHEVNSLPYNEQTMHMDIIEIDAASNRRIDEIRDLREKVHIAPTSAKYKVYIIDEVHMLTREAFNALLKTLEEPPQHCIFILATTEAHKLPETIISRTQRFNFKPVGGHTALEHIKNIARKEKIDIEPEAIELIVKHGEGSFRDSIGILDQLNSVGGKVSAAAARQFLGLPPEDTIKNLSDYIYGSDTAKSLEIVTELKGQGTSAPKIAERLSAVLRDNLIHGDEGPWIPSLLRQLLLVASSPSPYDHLEISILEAASIPKAGIDDTPNAKIAAAPVNTPKVQTAAQTKNTDTKAAKFLQTSDFSIDMWQSVIDAVKSQAASVYTALRLAQPEIDGDTLTLSFQFPLHQKKLSQANNIEVLGSVIENLCGKKMTIKCVVDKKAASKPLEKNPGTPHPPARNENDKVPINTISNIFGGAEVLES